MAYSVFVDAEDNSLVPQAMYHEAERLKTYTANWTYQYAKASPANLARIGFYSLNYMDAVRCAFCKQEIRLWQHNDDPIHEHVFWSPKCEFICGNNTLNVPLPESAKLLEFILPSYHVRCAISYSKEKVKKLVDTSSKLSYPLLRIEAKRLATFTSDWPKHKYPDETFAAAGFFYMGSEDKVQCFSCGGCVRKWEYNDDPWKEHARLFPECKYLYLCKGVEVLKKNATTPASDRDRSCSVCLENECNAALDPCGHLLCGKCAGSVIDCPLCRQSFVKILKLYF